MAEKATIAYVVNELHWRWNDEWYEIQDDTPVRVFRKRRDAEDYRQKLERRRREELLTLPPNHRTRYTPHTASREPEPYFAGGRKSAAR